MSGAGPTAAWLDEAFHALRPAARPLASTRIGEVVLRQWTTEPDWFADHARAWQDPGAPTRHTDATVDVILAPLSDLPTRMAPPRAPAGGPGPDSQPAGSGDPAVRWWWDESRGLLLGWHADRGQALFLTEDPPDGASASPLLLLARWLVDWAGGVLVDGASLAAPQAGAAESRGLLLLCGPDEDGAMVTRAARRHGWTAWDAGPVAVFPDDRGWSAVPVPGPPGPGTEQPPGGATSGRRGMRTTGVVLLGSDRTNRPASSPEPTSDAGSHGAGTQPIDATGPAQGVSRLCAELPVRTMRLGGDPAEALPALETWQSDSRPLVSVVIPVRNGARYLRRSISSIIGQQGARFQLIAVDDGSTDNSLSVLVALLPEVLDAGHELTITQHREQSGAAAALTTGMAAAVGEYLAFLDQQDEWLPGCTEVLLTALRRGARPAVAGAMEHVSDEEGLPDWATPEWFGDALPGSVAGAMLLRRSALDGVTSHGGAASTTMDGTGLIARLRDSGALLEVPAVVLRRWVRSGERPTPSRTERGHLRLVRER